MELIRLLLFNLEDEAVAIPDQYDRDAIVYHKALLVEAGLAIGNVMYENDEPKSVVILRPTWAGHEFLDASRDETGWKLVMKRIATTVGTTTLPVLQSLLTEYAKGALLS
jgi:hypothetical protein